MDENSKDTSLSEERIENLEKQLSELAGILKNNKISTDKREEEKYVQSELEKEKKKNSNFKDEKITKLRRQINELTSENKQLKEQNEEIKSSLEEKKKTIEEKKKDTERVKELQKLLDETQEKNSALMKKRDDSAISQERIIKLKKQINELKSEKKSAEERNEYLKGLVEEKKKDVKDYPQKIAERDDLIKKLNDQVSILKREKNIIDETNVRLFSEIDYLQSDIKKLSNQLETKDNEVKEVRELLDKEKKLSEDRLRRRLREFAKKETKKQILLTVRIRELMDVVSKQKEVIENIDKADNNLYEEINNTINQIKENRGSIDYAAVERRIDEMNIDVASVSDILEEPQEKVERIMQEGGEIDDSDFSPENLDEQQTNRLRESIRRSIESGKEPEEIKNKLIDSGEEQEAVEKAMQEEVKENRSGT